MSQITFVGQLWKVETRRDGGGRLILDFGADALGAILELQKLNAIGETSLGIAIVPYGGSQQDSADDGEKVDPITGEVILD